MTTQCTCTVENCIHNSDRCCCKSEILVDGRQAQQKENTSCASFDLRHGDSFRNSFETPDKKLSIECNAVHCVYNSNQYCTASQVDISGTSAVDSSATQCSTFKAK
ncbi:MAG: DUF1540 domain-containing protein [Lachnospiraceae bacterium]|nr:DUF1540 domain-containing protein [Lachnospiraceae bacterium]